jgi:hypothetical protein
MRFPAAITVGALAVLAAAGTAWIAGARESHGQGASGPTGSVLVELFTSEGCSSCPPADRLLRTLVEEQPVPGVTIVALSEHVDYWNRLGWRDPFSSATFSARQQAYALSWLRPDLVYTPQAVVSGHYEVVGSDRAALLDSIRRAAGDGSAASIDLATSWESGRLDVTVRVQARQPLARGTKVLLAVAEDDLTSDVRAGENAGHQLAHAAVTRRLVEAGRFGANQATAVFHVPVPLERGWAPGHLRLVAFAQDPVALRVVGVAGIPVPPAPGS